MKNESYNRPVFPVLFSTITGVVTGFGFPGFSFAAFFCAVISLCVTTACVFKKKRLKITPLFLFISTGYLLIQPYLDNNFPDNHITKISDSKKTGIIGEIVSRPVKKQGRCRFVLNVETIAENGSEHAPVSGKIRVSVYGDKVVLQKGDKISFRGRVRPFRNFYNPGGFDYERFMAFKGIWASAGTNSKRVKIIRPADFSPVDKTQDSIINFIDKNIIAEESGSIIKALIIGDKQWISNELRSSFNRTGTGHLLAISGLHVGIVGSFSFWVCCFILSFSSNLLWKARVLKTAGLLAVVPVLLYGSIAGMSPSTQRAVIMIVIVLLTYSFQAEHDIMNSLAFAALIILIVSPVALFTISFQLSFSAVFAIAFGVLLTGKEDDDNSNSETITEKVKTALLSYLLISFLAFAGTLPIVIFYFNQLSLISLLANSVLIPLVGFLVVPLGLMAVLILPLNSFAAGVLIKLSGFFLETALAIIHYLSDLSFASIKSITPSILEIIIYYVLFFSFIYLFKKRKHILQKNLTRAKLIICCAVLILVIDISVQVHKRFFNKNFKVSILDVGQGSSSLLEFPGGRCMLIDGGGFNDNSLFDVGERILAPLLWKKRIRTVETVVLSHPESDHLNGLLYILEHFHVKQVWSNGEKRNTQGYKEFLKIIKRKNIKHLKLSDINREIWIDGVEVKMLYPENNFIEKKRAEKWRNTNNNSLVLRAEFNNVSFLFPGDIMKKAEAELVELAGNNLKSTFLIAPHHGSKTSDTVNFLNRVEPSYAIISCGWKNRFKLPGSSVLKRFDDLGAEIYRTDYDGAVIITVENNSVNIDTVIQ